MRVLGCAAGIVLALGAETRAMEAQNNPDLRVTLSKAGALPEVPTRTNVAFVATIANATGVQASNVLTRVTMPAGFTNLSTTPQPGSGITCTIAGSVVNCTAPTMPGNSEKTFRISSTAPATITGQTQAFSLTAGVDPENTIAEGAGGNNNNFDSFSVTVATRADLTLSLTGAAGAILTTQVAPDIFYIVAASNSGDRAASNLLVRATLPKDVAFLRVQDNTLGTCVQNSTASNGALNINCTLSSLAAGGTGRVRILGRVQGSVPDKVQVTFAAAADPQNTIPERNDTDNTAFMVTTLRAPSDILISGTEVSATAPGVPSLVVEDPGEINCVNRDFDVSIDVRNSGPYRSRATAVTTTWPAGFSAVGGSCFGRCSVPTLDPGQTHRVAMVVHVVRATGLIRPTFVLDADQVVFDPVVGNNQATPVICGG